jgi:predicted dehydrogenase
MRVVVVGLGNQGKKRAKIAGPDLVATVDPFCSEATYQTLDQVALETYDAALVCTPDAHKVGLLAQLLQNRKHVLVEKPLRGNGTYGLSDLGQLAEHQGVVCYTAYNHRFEPHVVRLKEEVAKGWLGKIYQVKFFYGNGTARDVRNSTWKDQGLGVLADLGSHLLDWTWFLFGPPTSAPVRWAADCFENQAYDHYHFSFPGTPTFDYEMTLLSWKNTFRLELYAEKGSIHLDGLCKWGPSVLTIRRRVLPSGRPEEERETLVCPDPTWQLEYDHFLNLCTRPTYQLERDTWIEQTLQSLEPDRGGRP